MQEHHVFAASSTRQSLAAERRGGRAEGLSLTWAPQQRGSVTMPPETTPGAAVTPSPAAKLSQPGRTLPWAESPRSAPGLAARGMGLGKGSGSVLGSCWVPFVSTRSKAAAVAALESPKATRGEGKGGDQRGGSDEGRRWGEPPPRAPGRKPAWLKPLFPSPCSTDSSRARRGAKP